MTTGEQIIYLYSLGAKFLARIFFNDVYDGVGPDFALSGCLDQSDSSSIVIDLSSGRTVIHPQSTQT